MTFETFDQSYWGDMTWLKKTLSSPSVSEIAFTFCQCRAESFHSWETSVSVCVAAPCSRSLYQLGGYLAMWLRIMWIDAQRICGYMHQCGSENIMRILRTEILAINGSTLLCFQFWVPQDNNHWSSSFGVYPSLGIEKKEARITTAISCASTFIEILVSNLSLPIFGSVVYKLLW